MCRWHNGRGFTLVEMLVVIAIIAILVAIIFPVFANAREKARQTRCQTNLMQLVQGLKQYRTEYGMYPPPPWYDEGEGKYKGGFSALYPDYITDKNLLICPDDADVRALREDALDRVYSSYNGVATDPPDGDWALTGILYNYYGYTYDAGGQNGYSDGFQTEAALAPIGAQSPAIPPVTWVPLPLWMDDATASDPSLVPDWLEYQSLSWRHFPRLANNHAPDNTIVTHCIRHRDFYRNEARRRDVYVQLNAQADTVEVQAMEAPAAVPTNPREEVAGWVHHNL